MNQEANVAHHVLGKALGQTDVMPVFDKMSDGICILVGVPTGKTLIGHIKECIMLSVLDHLADLPPLFLGRVDTRRVMRTSVQQEHTSFWRRLHIRHHAIKVQPDRILVVVPVFFDLEPRVLEYCIVIRPTWGGNVNLFRAWIEALQESASNTQRAGTGYRLSDSNAVFLHRS